jgi:AcrR family transcriptional regulator
MDQLPKEPKKPIRPSRADLAAAQRKAAARRNRRKNIMNAAARLFCEKGFADTTMDQIAARVELTKPSLYSYFRGETNFKGKYDRQVKGKREILLTCLDEAVKKCIAAIDKFEDDKSPRGEHRLRFLVEQYADLTFQELGMRLLLSVGTQSLSAEQEETYSKKRADVNDRFKSLLADSMPVGAASPESLSEMFVSLVQGLATLQDSTETKQKILSIFLDLVIGGLSGARSEH